jgi:hypothetical protein
MFRKFESFTIMWNQRAWCKGKMQQLQDVITCCVRLQHPEADALSPCDILQLQLPLLRTSSAPLQAVVQSTEGVRDQLSCIQTSIQALRLRKSLAHELQDNSNSTLSAVGSQEKCYCKCWVQYSGSRPHSQAHWLI